MSPAQCRAARALLGLQQGELAAIAKVSVVTVVGFEKERTKAQRATVEVLRQALERAGVDFIDGDEAAGDGVRIATPSLVQA
ncbi:helix-turn-helix transcriptional regulator [Methylobacterium sp. WL7]|uniref:helix-turn-helix domain-containing protein n=1 Tax=Methylobacterium sp. WL7 TaxID=2603900 RepID=UPI0011CAD89B|nr:helix-turn-helix transcriptional regulator [Methylobacterium sp. WL7]TXN43868.1 transcriptional regulator [Methylobacterium sp. WL7]